MPSLPDIGSSLPDVVPRTAMVYLFLETDGSISVIPRDRGQPTLNRPRSEDHPT